MGAAKRFSRVSAVWLRRLDNASAASDLDGLGLGAEFGAAGAGVEVGAVPVEERVVFRGADGHFGDGVGDVLFAVSGLGRGDGIGRGGAAGEALEDRVGVCAAGLFERGWRGRGRGDQRSARCYGGVSVHLRTNNQGGGTELTTPPSPPMPRYHDPHGRATRRRGSGHPVRVHRSCRDRDRYGRRRKHLYRTDRTHRTHRADGVGELCR